MPRKFSTIVAPTDFSEQSRAALDYALDLVEAKGRVILCHVVDDVPLTYGYVGISAPAAEVRGKMADAAKEELARFAPETVPGDVNLDLRILHGSPFVEIVKAAKNAHADLIVMGTHGRTGISQILIGSVAEKVVRKAHCPVLVVRPEGTRFEHP